MFHAARLCGAVLMAVLSSGATWAQTKPAGDGAAPGAPAQAPVGAEPGFTTASYGDWLLRCDNANLPTGHKHSCEAVQTLQIQGQQAPFAQVAFGHVDGTAPLHLVVALPVNIAFSSIVKVGLDDKDPKPLELVWKRCLPGACFADAVAGNDVLGRWRAATAPARLQYTDATGRNVAVPVSFRGMSQALDALQKQP